MEAYLVPFRVDRSRAPRYRFVNESPEPLRWVRAELVGPGVASGGPAPLLRPGAALEVTVLGRDLALATRLIVRWSRPDGAEYLWGVSF